IGDKVGDQIKRPGKMLVQNSDIVGRDFAAGERVYVAAYCIALNGYLARRSVASALEQRVFDKVRDAILRGLLVTRTRAHPNTDRGRAHVIHLFRDYCETVFEDCLPDGTDLMHCVFTLLNLERGCYHTVLRRRKTTCDFGFLILDFGLRVAGL